MRSNSLTTRRLKEAQERLLKLEKELELARQIDEERRKKEAELQLLQKQARDKGKERGEDGAAFGTAGGSSTRSSGGGSNADDSGSEDEFIGMPLYERMKFEELKEEELAAASTSTSSGGQEAMVPLSVIKQRQMAERAFMRAVVQLREKLNDAHLTVMNKTMRTVLTFEELIKLSDALISNVALEAQELLKVEGLQNPSWQCLLVDLVMEVCVLMQRLNDFAVGINRPTIEKMDQFKKEFEKKKEAEKERRRQQQLLRMQQQAAAGRGQQQKKSGGFFSFLWN